MVDGREWKKRRLKYTFLVYVLKCTYSIHRHVLAATEQRWLPEEGFLTLEWHVLSVNSRWISY